VNTVADTFRVNPKIDTRQAITELGVGEALVSILDKEGVPTPVERVLVRPPESQIGPITDAERRSFVSRSPLSGRYEDAVDRVSAYELLKQRAEVEVEEAQDTRKAKKKGRSYQRQGIGEAMFKSAARSIGSQIGRQLIRGLLGSLLGGRR